MKVCRLSVIVVAATVMIAGCPLPFDFNGNGAVNSHTSDPSSPNISLPVVVSYSEQGGTSGTIADGDTHVSGQTTVVTLSTTTENALIFYTDDGTEPSIGSAKKTGGPSGQITITRTSSPQSLVIHAIALGPNMLPSPVVQATVIVSPAYTVTYDGNGGSGGVPTDGNSYLSGMAVKVASPGGMVRSDFTFARWNTAKDGTGTAYAAGSNLTIESADVILYAIWTPIPKYFVTYDGNGGSGVPTDGTGYQAGASVTVLGPGALSLANSVFAGWNTAANGSGSTYSGNDTFAMGTGDVTLYAIWLSVSGTTITSVPLNVTNVVIPEGVTDIGVIGPPAALPFQGHLNLTRVTIPSSVTFIRVQAFIGCPQLTTIVSNNARYKVINGALVDTVSGTLMLVPAKLSGAFDIPSSVISVDPYAFGNCASLTSITIPASLTTISLNAFSGLQSPISMTIPSTVTHIVGYAFFSSSVTSLTMQSSAPPMLDTNVFYAPLGTVHVPSAAAVAAYTSATNWGTSGVSIVTP